MLLTTLQHGSQWDTLDRVFKMNGPTFERHCTCLCSFVRMEIFKVFVVELTADLTMGSLREQNMGFQRFSKARYALDAAF